jgi:hypothetical protein
MHDKQVVRWLGGSYRGSYRLIPLALRLGCISTLERVMHPLHLTEIWRRGYTPHAPCLPLISGTLEVSAEI